MVNITSSSFSANQQVSSQMAQRKADQAEALAQSLKSQANAAQSRADREKENANTLNTQSSQAHMNANSTRQMLNTVTDMQKGVAQVTDTINHQVQQITPASVPAQAITSSTTTVSVSAKSVGAHIDTTA